MMKTRATILLALLSFVIIIPSCVVAKQVRGTTLRVALYPYVPDRLSLFQKIEHLFESRTPGVNLELVDNEDLLSNYYSGGLQKTKADVYEVDTILLSDLVNLGKIVPLTLTSLTLDKNAFTPEAMHAVTREGKIYAVPHWMCGNFLFYKKGDQEVQSAKTWLDLNRILTERNETLFVDLKGASTLGEWYLTALSGRVGLSDAQDLIMNSNTLDQNAVDDVFAMLGACPAGFCRNDDLHERTGFYSRAFVSGRASAYLGYSESIHYGIQYALDNCTNTSGCLSIDEISVTRIPPISQQHASEGIGWVDALALDANLTSDKKVLAMKFIMFMLSDDAYKAILEPDWGEAPRYLLPAKKDVQIKNAPLYPSFYRAHAGRHSGTATGLNDKLRTLGKALDCTLPINRTDINTINACKR